MRYKNTRTGAVINSPTLVSGGNWIPYDESEKLSKPKVTIPEPEVIEAKEPPKKQVEAIKLSKKLEDYTIVDLKEIAFSHDIELKGTKKDDIVQELKDTRLFE